MSLRQLLYLILIGLAPSCANETKEQKSNPDPSFEKISYYKYPVSSNDLPFKFKLTYYFNNGEPHRWMELDSLGQVTTDYIYEYDSSYIQTGARYREDGAVNFSIEKVTFKNDSTKVTEWIDSVGQVFYTMIDNLNKNKKTFRAEFIGDRTHGFDSTFYTDEGFEKRIFFTNTKGKIFNDRKFQYDSIDEYGEWVIRKKVIHDTISEVQVREIHYDKNFVSQNGKYYEGLISTGEWSENVISFSGDGSLLIFTRTSDWANQSGYFAHAKNGLFTETIPIRALDSIYNASISPNGDKILYSTRKNSQEEIWLLKKANDSWSSKINLTESSGIEGGYFYWLTEMEIYFQTLKNSGDLAQARLKDDILTIEDNLTELNTTLGTEFSPYVDKEKRFIIFTRYMEGDQSQQGFFISYNSTGRDHPTWGKPKKIGILPYGWSAFIINDGKQFIYTDGDDIYGLPTENILHHEIP
ncbi:hypothetical protein [Sediminicola sp. 1XM1-17]|uniref:hypothetical protein n=1 Tax=Sediminicola sp. 1XM1-17 TaxID=3127702 RepID=UPI003076A70F